MIDIHNVIHACRHCKVCMLCGVHRGQELTAEATDEGHTHKKFVDEGMANL